MIRAFLSLELGEAVLARYAAFHGRATAGRRDLRWVRPENLHLTLRFLGDTAEDRIEPLRREIGGIALRTAPFTASLGEPGCFGAKSAPSVLWFAVERGADRLSTLAAEIEDTVQCLRFPPEDKDWRAHLTVARNPRRSRCEDWPELLAASGLCGMEFEAGGITLFSSDLRPGGPLYTRVWVLPLGGESASASQADSATNQHDSKKRT